MDEIPYYCDPPQPSGPRRWRWFSEWPRLAQVCLMLAIVFSGANLTWGKHVVQPVVISLFAVWLVADLNVNTANPWHPRWQLRTRILVSALLLAWGAIAVAIGVWR